MKKLNTFLILFFICLDMFLIWKIFKANNNILKVFKLKSYIKRVQNEIEGLKITNLKLIKKIRTLKKDRKMMKRLIKEKMLFIEKNEVLYIVRRR